MVTQEELQKKYTTLATADLLEILANKPDYTQTAIDAAQRELRTRNVSEIDIKSYKSPIETHKEILLEDKSYLVDLAIWQKVIFYFI